MLFFSSRRRHTILSCDWSSDVCSSDLMIRRPPRSTLFPKSLPISVVAVSLDRKSTRLNSSHTIISYAVFCVKKNSHPSLLQVSELVSPALDQPRWHMGSAKLDLEFFSVNHPASRHRATFVPPCPGTS